MRTPFPATCFLLRAAVVASILVNCRGRVAAAPAPAVSETASTDAFPLVGGGRAAPILTDEGDAKVVQIAADLLADDVERITGKRPAVRHTNEAGDDIAVLVGTIGKTRLIDHLAAQKKIDVSGTQGKWEAFTVARAIDPMPGIKQALVIAGSDRRGTAYGVVTLSEAIGVSPWYWWADVPPRKMSACYVNMFRAVSDAPSVKYRGIFINDEDWGLNPWAAKTFEPEVGDIGPKTYARVCELLLRLRANYLWPAMHPCTKAFNTYPQNKIVADDYAIVMGSSHAEPMLRDNVSEWDAKVRGPFDYEKNRDGVDRYWEERITENGQFENVYTLGMRGIHDSAMVGGGGTLAGKVALLQRVINDQRDMLGRLLKTPVEAVPQAFVPYKEVLPLYDAGLRIPDDVTLVWPDDNHGYIRRLSNGQERKRPGGAGVYYHLSYWGAPEDYLWLCSTPPALVWEEMSRAYDYGARTLWVANMGDIKPGEIGMDFFLRLAWKPEEWGADAQPRFIRAWALRTFGETSADEIAAIMAEYYTLNYAPKPEHMLSATFSWTNYDEAPERLRRFDRLVARTNTVYEKIPAEQKAAFYELVVYPVRGSALMNQKVLWAERARASASDEDGEKAVHAYDAIARETLYYNQDLAGGKWNRIMSDAPRNGAVFRKPDVLSPKGATNPTMPPVLSPTPISEEVPAGVARAFVEQSKCVSMEAEHATRSTSQGGASWKVVAGLGRSGDSMTVFPTSVHGTEHVDELTALSPSLEYDFTTTSTGAARVLAYCVPTHAAEPGRGVRYAVAIDTERPTIVDVDTLEFSKPWAQNVLRAAAIGSSDHQITAAGTHTLHVWMVDPGVVLDKFVIDLGGAKPSYLGPPETVSVKKEN